MNADVYPDANGPTPEKAQLGPPSRWLHCPPMGEVIARRFLPFKTPLCLLYDTQIDARYRFHPSAVFASRLPEGMKLGLWIDLTKTNRYYSKKEIEREGCVYRKMPMEGHAETPSPEQTREFIRCVESHLQSNPRSVIAVHCTHGFNRTGFLISAYLTEKSDWAVDASIGEFARCRPVGIYKQEYVDELFRRYGDLDDRIIVAERPAWCFEGDVQRPSTSVASQPPNGIHHPISQAPQEAKTGDNATPKFMDGLVPSVHYVTDASLRTSLQKKMCGWKKDGFPGSQPVSMERSPQRDNLALLAQHIYRVSWKADGLRYMVLIAEKDAVFAFDRDNNVFRFTRIAFPHGKMGGRHVRNTLVDAEMIIDKDVRMENGDVRDVPRLLIYDIIKFEGMDVSKFNYDQRLACIDHELIDPRRRAMQEGLLLRADEPISVRRKQFWPVETVAKLFAPKFTDVVGHEIDGLIFQPLDDPYIPGRCDRVLKWKPPSHNSVDFKLRIVKEQRPGMLTEFVAELWVQHWDSPFGRMKATRELRQYDHRIIECTYKDGQWHFMRERTDKSRPNALATAEAVCNSILHPISQEMLIQFIENHAKRTVTQKRPHHDGDHDATRPPKKALPGH